jgi:hypothetical protein
LTVHEDIELLNFMIDKTASIRSQVISVQKAKGLSQQDENELKQLTFMLTALQEHRIRIRQGETFGMNVAVPVDIHRSMLADSEKLASIRKAFPKTEAFTRGESVVALAKIQDILEPAP